MIETEVDIFHDKPRDEYVRDLKKVLEENNIDLFENLEDIKNNTDGTIPETIIHSTHKDVLAGRNYKVRKGYFTDALGSRHQLDTLRLLPRSVAKRVHLYEAKFATEDFMMRPTTRKDIHQIDRLIEMVLACRPAKKDAA